MQSGADADVDEDVKCRIKHLRTQPLIRVAIDRKGHEDQRAEGEHDGDDKVHALHMDGINFFSDMEGLFVFLNLFNFVSENGNDADDYEENNQHLEHGVVFHDFARFIIDVDIGLSERQK